MEQQKRLIDRGTYYEIEGYETVALTDEYGNNVGFVHCPYIPKFLVDPPSEENS